ncbi:MAG: hypothetical protein OXQ92_04530 [Boseongicola sp.]|nr:hypothetical protein [Boseongicola sp.]MDD9978835.1 hypothetical protein [Boseongicola sp.]
MSKRLILSIMACTTATLVVTAAEAGPRNWLDRVEDRIDRRESIIDERVDYGRRDVIEDRIDRRESVADRRGYEGPRFIDRWERRSWWRLWGDADS